MRVLIQAVPSNGANLKALLEQTRREKAKMFHLSKRGKWTHRLLARILRQAGVSREEWERA